MIMWVSFGGRPNAFINARPAGASCVCPGDNENLMAVFASAAIMCSCVVRPPRDVPVNCGPFFLTPPFHPDAP